jgi:hypothetical protein
VNKECEIFIGLPWLSCIYNIAFWVAKTAATFFPHKNPHKLQRNCYLGCKMAIITTYIERTPKRR